MNTDILYFDYAATTPCAPEVADAMHACLTCSSKNTNASSSHRLADSAFSAIAEARAACAKIIGAQASGIFFTSGATESNNFALLGLSAHLKAQGKTHIVSSTTEHKAILDTLKHLKTLGHEVTLVNPDSEGIISLEDLKSAIQPNTGLITIMHVNNETGTIQDIASIGALAKQYGALFHVDAAQSAGKLPIDVAAMNIDLLSMTAHKVYGPKGSGAMYVRTALHPALAPILHGGGQEKGLRPGTYANHQIVGLGKSLELAGSTMQADLAHSKELRATMLEALGDVVENINGSSNGLPNILNVSIGGVGSGILLASVKDKVALAAGSACTWGTTSASHVLSAMGLDRERISNAVRISFGRYTTIEQAKQAGEIIRAEVQALLDYLRFE